MITIEELRQEIEHTDAKIIENLVQRQALSKKIGLLKMEEGKEIVDLVQERKLFEFYDKMCEKYGLQRSYVKSLFKIIIHYSRKTQA